MITDIIKVEIGTHITDQNNNIKLCSVFFEYEGQERFLGMTDSQAKRIVDAIKPVLEQINNEDIKLNGDIK